MSKRTRRTIDDAVSRYWYHLLPIFCVPMVMVLTGRFDSSHWWALPVFAITFFGSCAYAAVPCFLKGAPSSFWTVACLTFGAGILVAAVVFMIMSGIARNA